MVRILDHPASQSRNRNINITSQDREDSLDRLTRRPMARPCTPETRVPPGVTQDKAPLPRVRRLRKHDHRPSQHRPTIPAPFLAWQRSLAGGEVWTTEQVLAATRNTNTRVIMVFSAAKGIKATKTAPNMVAPCPISNAFSDLAAVKIRTRVDSTHQRQVREGRVDPDRAARGRLHISQDR